MHRSADFHLADEILAVIPKDPLDQLDLARNITSLAIASRVSHLEAEVSEKDRTISELRSRVAELEGLLQEANTRLRVTNDENDKLYKELGSLAVTAKKLARDLSKGLDEEVDQVILEEPASKRKTQQKEQHAVEEPASKWKMLQKEHAVEESASRRNMMWKAEEDIVLMRALFNVPKDETTGERSWIRIAENFIDCSKQNRKRNINQMRMRWKRIKTNVIRWQDCYNKIEQQHPDRVPEDIIDQTYKLYAQEVGKPFILEHCWEYLRNEKRWLPHEGGNPRLASKRAKVSESGAYTVSESGGDSELPNPKRLVGKGTLKAIAKGKGKAAFSHGTIEDSDCHV